MRWRDLVVMLLLLAAALIPTAASAITPISPAERSSTYATIRQKLSPGRSYALVIGISQFDNAAWHTLTGVTAEVGAMRAKFHEMGFTVVDTPDTGGRLDHAALKTTIENFFRSYGSDPANRLILYVATHGYADPGRPDGDGYLIASDAGNPADGKVENGYGVRELSAALTAIAAQHVYLFFDLCFSGAMLPEPTRDFDSLLAQKPKLGLSKETASWAANLLAHNARLVLTAGDATETVLDNESPFADAVLAGLSGEADTDGDGLILGSELAQFVRARVARATRLLGHPNDPVFAVLPKLTAPTDTHPSGVDYAQQGDFLFLNPGDPTKLATGGVSAQDQLLALKQAQLPSSQFLACVDCPTMVKLPAAPNLALAATEITYAQWDACYREMGCHRYLGDDGFGRGDRPAGNMTWLDAVEYLTWLNSKGGADAPCITYRFPTSDEWNYAALYGTAGQVTWATAVADGQPVCWGCGGGEDGQAALRTASSPADAAGLYDMVGNLWEWVEDDHGACDLTRLRQTGQCTPGHVMGGSYATQASALPAIAAGGTVPRTGDAHPWSSPTIGLRVACDVRPQG